MKKNQVYIALIVLLVVMNLFQLAVKFAAPKPPRHIEAENLRKEIPVLLNLNESQKQDFFKLVSNHREKIKDLHKQQRELTQRYIEKPSEALLNEIADFQKQKIILTENHFNQVYGILSEQQKVNFPKFKQAVFTKINR